jgi:hypothetical protein
MIYLFKGYDLFPEVINSVYAASETKGGKSGGWHTPTGRSCLLIFSLLVREGERLLFPSTLDIPP